MISLWRSAPFVSLAFCKQKNLYLMVEEWISKQASMFICKIMHVYICTCDSRSDRESSGRVPDRDRSDATCMYVCMHWSMFFVPSMYVCVYVLMY